MPIECSIPIQTVSLDELRALDYQEMSHAFACQNAIRSQRFCVITPLGHSDRQQEHSFLSTPLQWPRPTPRRRT